MTKSFAAIDRLLTSSGIRDDWAGSPPANGVLEVEATTEFYRLWSALLFLYCMKEKAKDDGSGTGTLLEAVPDDLEFGHGFLLAGAMFVHLLDMKERFELLDFTSHMMRVDAHEKNSAPAGSGGKNAMIGMVDAQLQYETDFLLYNARLTKVFRSFRSLLGGGGRCSSLCGSLGCGWTWLFL